MTKARTTATATAMSTKATTTTTLSVPMPKPMSMSMSMTQDRIDRYGRVNGDAETLHYDAEHARQRGFRGTIAHGTMLAAPLFDLAIRRFGPGFLRNGRLSLKWTAPVCAGDRQLVSIDEDGRIEAAIENLPDRPVSVLAQASLRE